MKLNNGPYFIILDSQDRLGKDTQIELIYNSMDRGVTQKMHYGPPPLELRANEQESYSINLYTDMFRMFQEAQANWNQQMRNIICNRGHIGEAVYSPLYRGYSGEFIYDIEKVWLPKLLLDHVFLITMVTDNEFIIGRNDNKGFAITNKNMLEDQYQLFVKAHNKSAIKNKLLLSFETEQPSKEIIFKEIFSFLNSQENKTIRY